ncbi:head outer capsid protein [Enterobacter phage ZX14]
MADLPNPATLEIVQNYDSFPRPFEDETFILSAQVTGLDDAVISDYNWSFRDQFYNTPTLEPTWIRPGTEQVILRATVSKPGYEDEQFEAYYTLTSGLGYMGSPSIKIEGPSTVTIEHLSNTDLKASISVTHPLLSDPSLTLKYTWSEKVDNVLQPIANETNSLFTARGDKVGTRIYTVEAKLTHPNYMVTRVFATKDVTVVTTPLSNTVGSNLEPGNKTVLIDEPVTLVYILDLSRVESPISNIVYSWYVDDVLVEGAVGPNYTFSQSTMKQYKVSAKAEIIFIGSETYPPIISQNNATITVIPDVTLSIEASHQSLPVPEGEKFVLSPKIIGIDLSNATVAYEWTDQGTKYPSVNLEPKSIRPGENTYHLKVTISAPGYSERSFEASYTVNIPDMACELIYVHPLPWRASAYIWAGWWVMDAIQKLTSEGKDWKTASWLDSPYHCHLAVLSKMITDYPEVDVQESRNGRIVHRSALENGIIYDYIY